MIDLKFEVTIRTNYMGIGGLESWESAVKDILNSALAYSHCDEVKVISSKEITK